MKCSLTEGASRRSYCCQHARALWQVIAGVISLTYLVLNGHFGNHALQIALQRNLHLISKLRCDAALYFPYVGPYAGQGPHRKYGSKVDYDHIPGQYPKRLRWRDTSRPACTRQLLHKGFTQPLNVVILAKTNLRTQARAHVILFSSDLALAIRAARGLLWPAVPIQI